MSDSSGVYRQKVEEESTPFTVDNSYTIPEVKVTTDQQAEYANISEPVSMIMTPVSTISMIMTPVSLIKTPVKTKTPVITMIPLMIPIAMIPVIVIQRPTAQEGHSFVLRPPQPMIV